MLLLLGLPALAFVVNAATFGASAVCVLAIRADGAFRVERVTPERRAGLLRQVADGAAALRAHPAAIRLVGADIICSLVYGMQTVLLILVARRPGSACTVTATCSPRWAPAAWPARRWPAGRPGCPAARVLVARWPLVGLPVLLLAVVHWGPAAIVLAGATGAGAILRRDHDRYRAAADAADEVFGGPTGWRFPCRSAALAPDR